MTRPRSELDAHLELLAKAARDASVDPTINDDLAPARGIMRGFVLGVIGWALVVLIIYLVLMPPAHAMPPLRGVATVAAWHEYRHYYCESDQQFHDYNAAIPGVGIAADVTDDTMLTAGVWRTSHGQASPFALADWRPLHRGPASFGLFAGVSGGYCRNGKANTVIPLAGATVRVDFDRIAVHLLALPPTNVKPATVALAFSIAFE